MAGLIRGKIEMFFNEGNGNNNAQALFKSLYDFFVAHPKATLVARQAGSGRAAGDIGYWDSGTPFANNAFFVVKMARTDGDTPAGPRAFDHYVLIQWSDGSTQLGASPGNPGLGNGSTSASSAGKVGIAVAVGAGGDGNPWNGAGATLGSNTKGSPVWKVPTGGSAVHVLPRSNNALGSQATNRENLSLFFNQYAFTAGVRARAHVISDDDSFVVLVDNDDDNTYSMLYLGVFTPRQGLVLPYPLLMIGDGIPLAMNTVHGDTAGTSGYQGGAIHRDSSVGVKQLLLERLPIMVNTTSLQPNRLFATPEYDEFPIACALSETPYHGYLGQLEFIREVGNIATHDTSSDRKRVVIGNDAVGSVKLSVPWDGTTTPKSGITRQGIDFTRAGP